MPSDTDHFSALLQALLLLALASGLGLGLGSLDKSTALFAPVLPAQETAQQSALRTIGIEEAARLQAEGTAVFLDARDNLDYLDSHLPGAGNLPFNARTQDGKPVTVILYCSDPSCGKAATLGRIMHDNGIDIAVMPEGVSGWADSGGPLEMSQ